MLLGEINKLKDLITSAQTPAEEEIFLDNVQVKKLLNVSDSTLYRLRKRVDIPFAVIGGRTYYPKKMLTKALLEKISKKIDDSKRFDD